MSIKSTFASALAMTAALSMATPAFAADLGQPVPYGGIGTPQIAADPVWDSASENADRYRRYRHRRHRGVDAGDVIAGVLVLGTIAAIAGAANNNRDRDRDRRYRDRDYRDRDYRDNRDRRSTDTGGLNRAVDMCLQRIERDVRVESVDNVDRNGEGWRVSGALYNGEPFTCRIDNNGRIDGIDYGAGFQGANAGDTAAPDRQYSDDRYAAAWQNADRSGQSSAPSAAPVQTAQAPVAEGVPAYPGGPINGDPAQVDLPEGSDGRYSASRSPDFEG